MDMDSAYSAIDVTLILPFPHNNRPISCFSLCWSEGPLCQLENYTNASKYSINTQQNVSS